MIVFSAALVKAAQAAGIKVPDDPNNYDHGEYIHWHVFCAMQLGAPMPSPSSHWNNAKTIAAIPDSEIKTVTHKQILERGFEIGHSK